MGLGAQGGWPGVDERLHVGVVGLKLGDERGGDEVLGVGVAGLERGGEEGAGPLDEGVVATLVTVEDEAGQRGEERVREDLVEVADVLVEDGSEFGDGGDEPLVDRLVRPGVLVPPSPPAELGVENRVDGRTRLVTVASPSLEQVPGRSPGRRRGGALPAWARSTAADRALGGRPARPGGWARTGLVPGRSGRSRDRGPGGSRDGTTGRGRPGWSVRRGPSARCGGRRRSGAARKPGKRQPPSRVRSARRSPAGIDR